MPLFHTGGCGLATLGVVSALDTQALVEAYDPALVLTLTHQHRAQVMVGVPAMLIANLGHPDFARTGSPFTIVCGQTECSPGPR
jgi:fatty-acyl-CoA synthase